MRHNDVNALDGVGVHASWSGDVRHVLLAVHREDFAGLLWIRRRFLHFQLQWGTSATSCKKKSKVFLSWSKRIPTIITKTFYVYDWRINVLSRCTASSAWRRRAAWWWRRPPTSSTASPSPTRSSSRCSRPSDSVRAPVIETQQQLKI